jgi:molybdenum cofactor biosynthesis enzyme
MAGKQKFTDAEMIEAINAAEGNVSQAAKDLDVSRSALVKRKAALPEGALITNIADFRVKRADVFADLQRQVLAAITPDKLVKCSAQQLATIAAILYDKERLEHNLSTENVAHNVAENMTDEDREFFMELQQKRTKALMEGVTYDDGA